jgi:hypothetical protein
VSTRTVHEQGAGRSVNGMQRGNASRDVESARAAKQRCPRRPTKRWRAQNSKVAQDCKREAEEQRKERPTVGESLRGVSERLHRREPAASHTRATQPAGQRERFRLFGTRGQARRRGERVTERAHRGTDSSAAAPRRRSSAQHRAATGTQQAHAHAETRAPGTRRAQQDWDSESAGT